jgi:hypothetical protein
MDLPLFGGVRVFLRGVVVSLGIHAAKGVAVDPRSRAYRNTGTMGLLNIALAAREVDT